MRVLAIGRMKGTDIASHIPAEQGPRPSCARPASWRRCS
jgi:hypothetical protein